MFIFLSRRPIHCFSTIITSLKLNPLSTPSLAVCLVYNFHSSLKFCHEKFNCRVDCILPVCTYSLHCTSFGRWSPLGGCWCAMLSCESCAVSWQRRTYLTATKLLASGCFVNGLLSSFFVDVCTSTSVKSICFCYWVNIQQQREAYRYAERVYATHDAAG